MTKAMGIKVKVGVARNTATGRWHIIAVPEGGSTAIAHTDDDLTYATRDEAMRELDRQIKLLGPPYTVEFMQ